MFEVVSLVGSPVGLVGIMGGGSGLCSQWKVRLVAIIFVYVYVVRQAQPDVAASVLPFGMIAVAICSGSSLPLFPFLSWESQFAFE